MDGSLFVASVAPGISLVALGTGRYDQWREGKQRREDLERAEQLQRQDPCSFATHEELNEGVEVARAR